MSSKVTKLMTALAGIAGGLVAFGVTELVHGVYQLVPSVLVSVAQRIIAATPGGLATQAIEALGQADVPFLISNVIVVTLVLCGLLAVLSLSRPFAALTGVAVLGAAAMAAALAEPFAAPVATAATVVAAFGAGSLVVRFLTRRFVTARAEEPEPDESESEAHPGSNIRSREAHSASGTSFNRRGFLAMSVGAAATGLAAVGVGRLLGGGGAQTASAPAKLQASGSSEQVGTRRCHHRPTAPP